MQRPRLLVVTLCAASLVTPSGGFGNRRLCGIQLVEALLFVCGEKGLFYQPGRRVREENIRAVKRGHVASPEEAKQVVLKDHVSAFRMTKRGIVEQCCHFYCDYYDLENYCNT